MTRTVAEYTRGHRDSKHTVHYTRVAGRRFEGLWKQEDVMGKRRSPKSFLTPEERKKTSQQSIFNDILINGDAGVERLRDVLGFLRVLKDRGQLPQGAEVELSAVEEMWRMRGKT